MRRPAPTASRGDPLTERSDSDAPAVERRRVHRHRDREGNHPIRRGHAWTAAAAPRHPRRGRATVARMTIDPFALVLTDAADLGALYPPHTV